MRSGGDLLNLSGKAAESIDLAADFLVGGFEDEVRRIKLAISRGIPDEAEAEEASMQERRRLGASVPIDDREEESEEDESSSESEDSPLKLASFSEHLLKISKDIVLPTSLAAMIAAKEKDGANAAEESRSQSGA